MIIVKIKPEESDRFQKMIDIELDRIYQYRKKETARLIDLNREDIKIKTIYKFPFSFKHIKRPETDQEVMDRAERSTSEGNFPCWDLMNIASRCKYILVEREDSLRQLKRQIKLGVDVYYDCSKHGVTFRDAQPETLPFEAK